MLYSKKKITVVTLNYLFLSFVSPNIHVLEAVMCIYIILIYLDKIQKCKNHIIKNCVLIILLHVT